MELYFAQLQSVYINEIERANNYLKDMVRQSFDSLHTSERVQEDFIAKINHIENRQYFHRKRKALEAEKLNLNSQEVSEGVQTQTQSGPNPGNKGNVSGVKLPHKLSHVKEETKRSTSET